MFVLLKLDGVARSASFERLEPWTGKSGFSLASSQARVFKMRDGFVFLVDGQS